MKHKIAKTLFILSFLPILFCIVAGIVCAFKGYTYTAVLGDIPTTIYGLSAFFEVFITDLVTMIFLGIIPACMVYQLVYLVIDFKKRNPEEDE
jgi:hypothetical protein